MKKLFFTIALALALTAPALAQQPRGLNRVEKGVTKVAYFETPIGEIAVVGAEVRAYRTIYMEPGAKVTIRFSTTRRSVIHIDAGDEPQIINLYSDLLISREIKEYKLVREEDGKKESSWLMISYTWFDGDEGILHHGFLTLLFPKR